MYIWSHLDTFNPSFSIKNIRDIALGNNFAILIDSAQKSYFWGSFNEKTQVPFYHEHMPSESTLKSLCNKAIKSICCGAEFAIALGRDQSTS